MNLLFALLALLLVSLSPQSADARAQHVKILSFCPFGAGTQDGCGQSPIVTMGVTPVFQHPNAFQSGDYFNTTAGTSTNYMLTNCGPSGTAPCRPQHNVFGVDYAGANYTPDASLADPATNPIPGCVFIGPTASNNSGTGGNIYRCGDSTSDPTHVFAGDIEQINLGPVGGHSCTALAVDGAPSTVHALKINNFKYLNDSGLCSTGVGSGIAIHVGDNLFTSVTISNYYADGGSLNFDDVYGGASCEATLTQCNPGALYTISFGSGTTVDGYGVAINFAARPVNVGAGTTYLFHRQFAWMENWCARAPNGHCEWLLGATSGNGTLGTLIDNNVILQSAHAAGFSPSPIFYADSTPMPFGEFRLKDSTIINSFIGGMPVQQHVSGCVGATFVGGSPPVCSGPGNTFFETAGAIGYGANLSVGCPGAGVIYKQLSPGTLPSGVIAEWSQDGGGSGQYAPNFLFNPVTCNNVVVNAYMASNAIASGNSNTPFTKSEITGNYVDIASQLGANSTIWAVGSAYSPSNLTGTISGTGLLGSSTLTIPTGALIYGAGISACSVVTSCPTVSSGGTLAQFSLSGSASVGPETLEAFANEASGTWSIATVGSTSTLTAAASLTVGDYVYAANITGCSTNPTSCPTIVSGSSPSWVLSANVGSVAAETMNTLRIVTFSGATSFNGTIDNGAVSSPTSGNVLLPSISLINGAFIDASTVGSCAASVLNCPVVTNGGTNTRFTMTFSVASVGPIAMTAQYPSWCTTPTVFTGNVEMGNAMTPAALNQWSSNGGIGC